MATAAERKATDASVASEQDNSKLEHTAGGTTTRDDALDMGVPMLPGKPDEPVGPEDALGEGPKRGDYSGRIGPSNYQPHEVRAASAEDVADPNKPSVIVEAQRPRVDEVGDAPGKGGVTTA
jgi:hypothetical protein